MNENEHSRCVTLLIAEDDDGHAELIRLHLLEAGLMNPMIRFRDGQEILDYFYQGNNEPKWVKGSSYLVLLDIRMPKIDGIEVLRQMKADLLLKKVPVIMLTTTDDPREIDYCYSLGCNSYITKPVEFGAFSEALNRLGLFLMIVQIPVLNREGS
jgi:CheY-like chemotaxis protein